MGQPASSGRGEVRCDAVVRRDRVAGHRVSEPPPALRRRVPGNSTSTRGDVVPGRWSRHRRHAGSAISRSDAESGAILLGKPCRKEKGNPSKNPILAPLNGKPLAVSGSVPAVCRQCAGQPVGRAAGHDAAPEACPICTSSALTARGGAVRDGQGPAQHAAPM